MTTQARAKRALRVPLLQVLQARPLNEDDLTRGISLTLSPPALNAVGAAHAGTLAAVLEATAYLALVGQLTETEEAVTHTFFASYVSPIPSDAVLESTGTVVRRGRGVAFVTVEMRAGDQIVAIANVAKSIRGS
jgi:acyl-coenzyme A thioesterase PaaI-like protein